MAFLGKLYRSDRHENLAEFFRAMGTPEPQVTAMVQSEPTTKLTKNGDTYTLTNTGIRNIEITFTNGGDYVEKLNDKMTLTSTFTLDGNVLTQVQKSNDGRLSITVTREFTDDSLTEKIVLAGWDGVAYRYFKA